MKRGRGGVQYEDLLEGSGAQAIRGTLLTVRYTLCLNRGQVLQKDRQCAFRLGNRCVILGLEYGVEGMRVGGIRRLRVGPHLGYLSQGMPDAIPAHAVLEFTVELLEVKTG